LNNILNNSEMKELLEEKLPKWKLGLGIGLICGMIFYGSNRINSILDN